MTGSSTLSFIGSFALVAWALPYMLPTYLPGFVIIESIRLYSPCNPRLTKQYMLLQRTQPAARDIKRMDSNARSHVLSGLMEQVGTGS